METPSPELEETLPETEFQYRWRRGQVAEMDLEIARLSEWFETHKYPANSGGSSMQLDLRSADDDISSALFAYRKYQAGKGSSESVRLASLGWATWAVTHASYRYTGYASIYFRQLAKLGGTILRAMTFHQLLEWDEDRKKEDREREQRKRIVSPWKDVVCLGCHAKKRTWADMTRWICGRCGTPLGHFPDPDDE